MWISNERFWRTGQPEQRDKNTHLKQIREGLINYFYTINALSNKKRAMHRAMQKPWHLQLERFYAQLTELNNYLPILPWSRYANNMDTEELNEIPPQAITNGRENKSYL